MKALGLIVMEALVSVPLFRELARLISLLQDVCWTRNVERRMGRSSYNGRRFILGYEVRISCYFVKATSNPDNQVDRCVSQTTM